MSADAYENGFCRLHLAAGDGYISTPMEDWDLLQVEFDRSRDSKVPVMLRSFDLFGADIRIDLRDIIWISRTTPESMERYEAHEEAEKIREKARKMIDGDA